jgi:hypothetical protein
MIGVEGINVLNILTFPWCEVFKKSIDEKELLGTCNDDLNV